MHTDAKKDLVMLFYPKFLFIIIRYVHYTARDVLFKLCIVYTHNIHTLPKPYKKQHKHLQINKLLLMKLS
ncbi:hypothetical protein GCM10022291_25170 [Postechiella marina]|uniref:Uncharacterized protein n=1 Tax=Postechiella marina TaxID=943941 RepID=A0ABP8CCU7_9FLAO